MRTILIGMLVVTGGLCVALLVRENWTQALIGAGAVALAGRLGLRAERLDRRVDQAIDAIERSWAR